MNTINPLNHPICLSFPARIAMSAWIGHVPFAMYLVDILRPQTFIELGTHYGVSYCAFCQAVKELRLATRCYAVDTWQGDAHAGFYGPEVLTELKEHHDPLYGGFSRLVQSTFEEALTHFPDQSFDLLHLDGFHTYEAMKRDFEQWLPKMTERGVILFHDINVRERDFGGWKLWAELKQQYPSFEFVHSHGLGVLAVGHDYREELRALLNCSEEEATSLRHFFSQLGARLEEAQELQTLRYSAKELITARQEKQTFEEQLRATHAQLQGVQPQVAALTQQLQEREAQLQEREAQSQEQSAQLSALTKHLDDLHRQATEREARLQEHEAQLADLTRRLQESEAGVKVRDVQIQEDALQIASLNRELKESEQQANEKEQHINEKELQLRRLLQQANEQELQRAQLSQQLEELKRQAREQETLVREAKLQLQASNHEIKEQEQKLLEQTQQLLEQTQQQLEQTQQLRELKQELQYKDRQLQLTGQQLQAQEQGILDLGVMLEGKEMQVRDLSLKLHEQERWLEVYKATTEEFSNSGSYRLGRALTWPLRLLKKPQAVSNGNAPRMALPHVAATPDDGARLRQPQTEPDAPSLDDSDDDIQRETNISNARDRSLESVVITAPKASFSLPDALFDAEWYLRENPDVAQTGLDPLEHYLRLGANEGRAPHPLFDPKFYLKTYPEAAISGLNPLHHYLTEGWKKGYKPNPKFDPAFYVAIYADIAEAGVEPLTHFITDGLREGRVGCLDDVYLEPFASDVVIPREPIAAGHTAFESDVKAVALYLPQFHPIPENDLWWGEGFTEWTNVRRGEAQFKDHYQPHIPSGLGYYDLREPDVLEQQVRLARDYGIHGFCFYYYWFAGKVLLDLPVRRMLETGKPDFPFCVCWANENWTRRWDGRESDILIAQQHSPEDDLAFLQNIKNVLLHKNYIRVNGKPLLIVYQPSLLPNAQATAERWREHFRAEGGGEIFLAAMKTFGDKTPPGNYGFDAAIQFPPHARTSPVTPLVEDLNKSFAGQVYDYNQVKRCFIDDLRALNSSQPIYPGVMPSWDNSARRRDKASIWINASPESYYDWLLQVVNFLRSRKPNEERFVFINAWNEWAEGCHLEPDHLFEYAWLNATRLALQAESDAGRVEDSSCAAVGGLDVSHGRFKEASGRAI
ncbi:MAG: glycoside hydrolase family 99-like domain-containing protein [Pyrinomonadaceae bacterium]